MSFIIKAVDIRKTMTVLNTVRGGSHPRAQKIDKRILTASSFSYAFEAVTGLRLSFCFPLAQLTYSNLVVMLHKMFLDVAFPQR